MHFLILLTLTLVSFDANAYNPKLESDSYFIQKTYSKETLESFAVEWAEKFELDRSIVLSVVYQESRWNHRAISHAEAKGLMQLLTSTAKDMGLTEEESLFNPYTNLYYGCKYLRWLLERYTGDYFLALVGYYSGPKWADRLRDERLREGNFKTEISRYAVQVLSRSEYMEVALGQETEAKEVDDL